MQRFGPSADFISLPWGKGKVDKEVARHPTTSQLVAAMTVISYITQVILSLMTEACLLSLLTNLN